MHRNSQKRIIEQGKIYFITTNTNDRSLYFKNEILAWLFIAQLKLTKILKGFKLYAFCILYDHVHLLLQPNDQYDITKIMFSLKKQFSHNANRVMGYDPMPPSNIGHPEGGQAFARLRGNDVNVAKMLDCIGRLHAIYYRERKNQIDIISQFKWQSSYKD